MTMLETSTLALLNVMNGTLNHNDLSDEKNVTSLVNGSLCGGLLLNSSNITTTTNNNNSNNDSNCNTLSEETLSGAEPSPEVDKIISDELRKILEVVFFVVLSGGISTVGCVTNVINMMVFWRQGFKDSVNISLFGLAIADFGSLFTLIWMAVCFTPQFRYSGIPFESTDVQYPTAGWPHMFFARSTSLITAFIAFERCLCIALPLKVKTILTARRTFFVVLTIFIVNLLSVVPMYYAINLAPVYLPARNRTLTAIIFRPGGLKIESVCFALTELYQLSSFVLVIIFTAILIRNLIKKRNWRQKATGGGVKKGSVGERCYERDGGSRLNLSDDGRPFSSIASISSDSSGTTRTVEKTATIVRPPDKERRVMILVLCIACIFIACFLPSATNLVVIILLPEYNITGRFKNTFQVTGGLCNACESINSSVNIILYYKMSSKYRAVFRKMIGAKDDGLRVTPDSSAARSSEVASSPRTYQS